MTHELFKKHRPKLFKDVLGQPDAIRILQGFIRKDGHNIPHSILFSGPSGVGKTTLARILAKKLECGETDLNEKNCADFRGIDMVRDIRSMMNLIPMTGAARVWIIDEAQKLTSDAQDAFLKMMEDTPRHVYFILCTTDPRKLKKTIITRCTEIKLKPITSTDLRELIESVAKKEGLKLSEDVVDKLIDGADGSARKALVDLNKIAALKDDDDQIESISTPDEEKQGIDICRALFNFQTDWNTMAKVLRAVDGDAETIRYQVLGYANSIALKGGGKMLSRAILVMGAFSDNFFDSKKSGLIQACYEVVSQSKR